MPFILHEPAFRLKSRKLFGALRCEVVESSVVAGLPVMVLMIMYP